MKARSKVITGIAALAVLGFIGAFGAWYFLIRSDAPPAVNLQAAIESVQQSQVDQGIETSFSTTGESLAGEWEVVSENSFTGYRVGEQLVGVGTVTAVGRTSDVTGTLSFDGEEITSVEVTADLTTLTSDKSMRDGQLRNQAIQTGTYPTATFILTEPIAIDEVPADGETVTQTISGQLTLHGVTRDVEIEVQGVIESGRLIIVGSTRIEFADYNIQQPTSQSVLSIDNFGIMEFQLVFAKSA